MVTDLAALAKLRISNSALTPTIMFPQLLVAVDPSAKGLTVCELNGKPLVFSKS